MEVESELANNQPPPLPAPAAAASGQKRKRKSNKTGASDDAAASRTPAAGAAKRRQRKRRKVANDNDQKSAVAMRNEVVLSTISRKLPVKDLLRLRGTCSTWDNNFIPAIQQRHAPIALTNLPDVEEDENSSGGGGEAMGTTTPNQLKKFTDLMRLSQEIPYSRFKLLDPTASPRAWLDLFTVCGSFVKNLTLVPASTRTDAPSNLMSLDRMMKELFELAPNLEELYINTRAFQPWNSSSDFQINSELRKLKKLTISGHGSEPVYSHPIFQDLLNELVRCATGLEYLEVLNKNLSPAAALSTSKNLCNLRDLKVHGLAANEMKIWIELSNKKQNPLRLTEFLISARRDDSFQLLGTFLTAQASYLRNLGVYGHHLSLVRLQLPKMEGLRYLDLNGYRQGGGDMDVVYEGGTLANTFPSLKTLACLVADSDKGIIDMSWNSHPEVTDLLLYSDGAGARKCLRLCLEYPALTHLQIDMRSSNMEDFRLLWSRWPNLESLHVNCYALQHGAALNLDEWLSGIPKSAFNDLKNEITTAAAPRKRWSTIALTLDRIRELLAKYKTAPGIGQLPRLQKLILNLTKCPSYKMTEVGDYFGVAMAGPSFRHISAKEFDPNKKRIKISPGCVGVVREALGPFAVIEL